MLLPIAAPARSSYDDGERSPSREHVVPLSRAADPIKRAPITSFTFAFSDQFVACNCGFLQLWFAIHQPSVHLPQSSVLSSLSLSLSLSLFLSLSLSLSLQQPAAEQGAKSQRTAKRENFASPPRSVSSRARAQQPKGIHKMSPPPETAGQQIKKGFQKTCPSGESFCFQRGSNSRPSDYETDALPTAP